MSYILDALRKSEHERQVATGQGVGMLYPFAVQQDRKLWMPVGLVVLGVILTCILIWWLWLQPIDAKTYSVTNEPVTVAVTPPPTDRQKVISAPKPAPVTEVHIPAPVPKKNLSTTTTGVEPKPVMQSKTEPSTATVTAQASSVDPIKDLPALSITGYIHNEQDGNLAMINNQLVREGEEVSPGLHLVKILDNSAIFSYKGYVFSR